MKRSKYGNVKTFVNGVKLDSGREAKRWIQLQLLQKAGQIADLERQVRFNFHINGKPVMMKNGQCARYTADFTYTENGKPVVEEVKGYKVRDYPLRYAFMKAIFDVTLREV